MDQVFVGFAIALSIIIVMPLYRVLVGPTLFDRLLGAGVIGTKTLVLIALVGVVFERLDIFVDIAVAYAVLNFIGNIAIAKYFVAPHRTGLSAPREQEQEST
jgi:multicomponent Na+:H+ antiporter subunit F